MIGVSLIYRRCQARCQIGKVLRSPATGGIVAHRFSDRKGFRQPYVAANARQHPMSAKLARHLGCDRAVLANVLCGVGWQKTKNLQMGIAARHRLEQHAHQLADTLK